MAWLRINPDASFDAMNEREGHPGRSSSHCGGVMLQTKRSAAPELITKADVTAWTKARQSRVIAAWTKGARFGEFVPRSRRQSGGTKLTDLVYTGTGCPHADLSPQGKTLVLVQVTNRGSAAAGPSITR